MTTISFRDLRRLAAVHKEARQAPVYWRGIPEFCPLEFYLIRRPSCGMMPEV